MFYQELKLGIYGTTKPLSMYRQNKYKWKDFTKLHLSSLHLKKNYVFHAWTRPNNRINFIKQANTIVFRRLSLGLLFPNLYLLRLFQLKYQSQREMLDGKVSVHGQTKNERKGWMNKYPSMDTQTMKGYEWQRNHTKIRPIRDEQANKTLALIILSWVQMADGTINTRLCELFSIQSLPVIWIWPLSKMVVITYH